MFKIVPKTVCGPNESRSIRINKSPQNKEELLKPVGEVALAAKKGYARKKRCGKVGNVSGVEC